MQAVPFGLAEAVSHYPKVGTLTRVKMFALARALIKEADYSKYKTVAASVENAFRKDLAALCKKHGIKY
jgi:hypothetical protein